SQKAVGNWLSGAQPRPKAAIKIANFFHVGVDGLLDPNAPEPLDAFENYLLVLGRAAKETEKNFPNDPTGAQDFLDAYLAKLIPAAERKKNAERYREEGRKYQAAADRLFSLAESIYPLDEAEVLPEAKPSQIQPMPKAKSKERLPSRLDIPGSPVTGHRSHHRAV
ncbi:MAG TPA: hypothetical protein VHH73_20225, partial [Verrucomicrobiae bacterium]|nr:hypothetical protein [Verrucomicrobiae bacterium]